ncbi:MAG: 2-amino-4-hydroxy-6-hydroxymethyldihydropteridine diphosphokinase [Desulfosalsimonadaceae bacterium]
MKTEAAGKEINIAYIAVGANLGDRIAGCRNGVSLLTDSGDIAVIEHSPYYYSAPVGYTDQPWFVNAVFKASTSLDPVLLLTRLKMAEAASGRRRGGVRLGPRVLDLDLIFYNDAVIRTPELIVPHPRMHQRAFVLRPLCDIAPELVHPVLGRPVSRLLAEAATSNDRCFALEDKVIDKTVSA